MDYPATDYAIMIPIVEMCRRPRYIPENLYFHERCGPADPRTSRAAGRDYQAAPVQTAGGEDRKWKPGFEPVTQCYVL